MTCSVDDDDDSPTDRNNDGDDRNNICRSESPPDVVDDDASTRKMRRTSRGLLRYLQRHPPRSGGRREDGSRCCSQDRRPYRSSPSSSYRCSPPPPQPPCRRRRRRRRSGVVGRKKAPPSSRMRSTTVMFARAAAVLLVVACSLVFVGIGGIGGIGIRTTFAFSSTSTSSCTRRTTTAASLPSSSDYPFPPATTTGSKIASTTTATTSVARRSFSFSESRRQRRTMRRARRSGDGGNCGRTSSSSSSLLQLRMTTSSSSVSNDDNSNSTFLATAVTSSDGPHVVDDGGNVVEAGGNRSDDVLLVNVDDGADDGEYADRKTSYNWTSQNAAIAVPALIGMLADPLLSLMDTLYVGRVGSTELAALGACTSIFHLAFNAFRATTAATTSLVSAQLGTHNERQAKTVTLRSLQLGFGIGIVVMTTLFAFGDRALSSMGVSAVSPLYPAAASYLYTRCWAAPVVLLITVAEGAFRGYGNTVVPLVASLVAAVGNVLLDPLLMFHPRIHWGVGGAAAATAISQVGAACIYGYELVKRNMLPPMKLFAVAEQKQSDAPHAMISRTHRSSGLFSWLRKIPQSVLRVARRQNELIQNDSYDPTSGLLQQHEQQQLNNSTASITKEMDSIDGVLTSSGNIFASIPSAVKTDSDVSAGDSSLPSEPASCNSAASASTDINGKRPPGVIRTILGANLSMMIKQGSLLFGWAFATACATRIGHVHVAAHQVALSVWLVFALILDGAAVSAQVLMARAYAVRDGPQVESLTKYMVKFALLQGLVSMLVVDGLDLIVPRLFTPDPAIQAQLHQVMPHLAAQQLLVSLTLVVESLAAGMNQFRTLAIGTSVTTVVAMWQISKQTSVDAIWFFGISSLFMGRLITSTFACVRAQGALRKERKQLNEQEVAVQL